MRFLPIIILTIACDSFEEVPCENSDLIYFESGIAFVEDEKNQIEEVANGLWNNSETNIYALADSLNSIEIICGIQSDNLEQNISGEKINDDLIIINISSDIYNDSKNLFNDNSWVEDFNESELISIAFDTDSVDPIHAYLFYQASIGKMADILVHEAAHTILGSHKFNKEQESTVGEPLDEIYSWGDSTLITSQNKQVDFYYSYTAN